jgi:chemotaxis protein CheD
MKRFKALRHGAPATIHAALTAKERRQRARVALPTGSQLSRYYLKPGELYIGEETALVKTLLGSCVAVAMFSPRCRVGSLCHSMLPSCGDAKSRAGNFPEGAKFVDCSVLCMLDWFLKRGILHDEIVVKVFGGSDMFSGPRGDERKGVGRQNIDMALKIIEEVGLELAALDVGGLRGRKIIFNTYTGEVFLKRLHRSELSE